jgi:hypothetical protein
MTGVSVAYRNADYIAERIYPRVQVDLQTDKYPVYDKERFRQSDDSRRPGTDAKEIDWGLSTDSYYADGHAMRQPIPDEFRRAPFGADLDVDTTETLTDKMGLNKEIGLVKHLVASATTVDMASTKWDTDANDPVKIVDTQKETIQKASGKRPNVLMLSRPVLRGVRSNAKVVGRVSGAANLAAANITLEQLATIFEVDEILVGDAVKDTAKKGQASSMDFVWGKYAALFYRPPAVGLRTLTWGAHFAWNLGSADKSVAQKLAGVPAGYVVYRFRVDTRHSDILEVMDYWDQKLVASGAGLLFSNVVA